MKSDQAGSSGPIEQLPASLRTLMALERFHLHKAELFYDPSRDPAFDTRYFPQNSGAFKLPCFWVPRKNLYVYGRQSSSADELPICRGQGQSEQVLFPVHPTSLVHYKQFLSEVGAQDVAEDGLCLWAVPTSSTRTLLVWPDQVPAQARFVKTSLHSKVVGNRRLQRRKVACSIGLSTFVQDSLESLPGGVSYFPESVGIVPRSMQEDGVIFRSIPQEIKNDGCVVAPLFSLLSGNERHPPLFLTIVERSGMSAERFLHEVLCEQFARLWLKMTLHCGLILEAHGQDLMLALSPDLAPLGRFYYRDFEGLQVDWELRRRYGLPEPKYLPHAWSWHATYATWGYRYSDLIWWKLMNSVHMYLKFVLSELDALLPDWRARGLIQGNFEKDTATMAFSQHIMRIMEQMFGVRVGPPYNIHYSLHKFAVVLTRIRREILRASDLPDSSR